MVYLGSSRSATEAFNFVGVELEFVYDLLFTKAPICHRFHCLSLILRSLYILILVAELLIIASPPVFHLLPKTTIDIIITFLLLSGAICLEIYSCFMYTRSKWTMMWYGIPKSGNNKLHLHNLYCSLIGHRLRSIKARKGITKMAQHDLLEYYVKAEASPFTPVIKLIDTSNLLQKFCHAKWKPVDDELKGFIYSHLKEKRSKFEIKKFDLEALDVLLGQRLGDDVIEQALRQKLGNDNVNEDQDWKMESTDFTRRIFVWHIATGLVYYDDSHNHGREPNKHMRIGKSLSDYMMYLLLVRPSMLPNGFSEMINKETRVQTQRLYPRKSMKRKLLKVSTKDFASTLLSMPHEMDLIETGALLDGGKFAKQLQQYFDYVDKWEMISQVWMEMMVFAASRCTWEEHAQQLRHGGELLTHVSLLMAHLGLSKQVQRLEIFDQDNDHDHDQSGSLPNPSFMPDLDHDQSGSLPNPSFMPDLDHDLPLSFFMPRDRSFV